MARTIDLISPLAKTFGSGERPLDGASPELKFVVFACRGEADSALLLYARERAGGGPIQLQTPDELLEGREAIWRWAAEFPKRFGADQLGVEPVVQTIAGGVAVTEMVIHAVTGGQRSFFTCVASADLCSGGRMGALRLYYHL